MNPKVGRLPPPLSVGYNVVRTLQLEGRIHIPTEGSWPISSMRVAKGWGYPNKSEFPGYGNSFLFPPPEPPDLDQKAKKLRTAYYLRTHTAEQCVSAVTYLSPVNAAFEITKAWENPAEGRIPDPASDEEIVGSHSIVILSADPERQEFRFDAGWGRRWGEDGMGRLPYSYFKQRLVDAYSMSILRPDLDLFHGKLRPVMNHFLWGQYITGEANSIVHVIEMYDASFDEYLGWAIVAERGEWLDVHELFVRPVVRNRGNGRGLIRMLQNLSEERSKHLRFWVSFADLETRSILFKLLRTIGYQLGPSTERWAAYLGCRSKSNKTYFDLPLPTYIPARPTASTPPNIKDVVAALSVAASLVSGAFSYPANPPHTQVSSPAWEYGSEQGGQGVAQPAASASVDEEEKPGTDVFDRKNARRFELIEKKIDGQLTDLEEIEFKDLQSEILRITKKHFPRPRVMRDALKQLMKEEANGKPDSPN